MSGTDAPVTDPAPSDQSAATASAADAANGAAEPPVSPVEPGPSDAEAGEAGNQPTPSEPDPDPVPTALSVTTEIAQFYRLDEGADEVLFEVEGLAPPGAAVVWILIDSHGEQWEDHTETTTADEAGAWKHLVNVHGPIECLRVEFNTEQDTVVSTPFDVITHDAEAPASLSSTDQELRLQRHASFVDGGLGRPSTPDLPFMGEPMAADSDPRVVLARDLARRGTSYGSVNDLGKAVLLLLDYIVQNDATQTPIGRDASAGKPPSLLV